MNNVREKLGENMLLFKYIIHVMLDNTKDKKITKDGHTDKK